MPKSTNINTASELLSGSYAETNLQRVINQPNHNSKGYNPVSQDFNQYLDNNFVQDSLRDVKIIEMLGDQYERPKTAGNYTFAHH